MGLLIVISVALLTGLNLWAVLSSLGEQYMKTGATITKLATRNIQYGVTVPEKVMDRVGEQMVVSALLVSELVAIAENRAGMSHEEITATLGRVKEHAITVRGYPLIDDFWVTDEEGRIYIGAGEEIDFRFTPDPARNPQAYVFYPLLQGLQDTVIQDFQERDKDGRRFKYVGVRGVDKPRIVQAGVGEQLVRGVQDEFAVQGILNQFMAEIDVSRMIVVDETAQVIAAAEKPGATLDPAMRRTIIAFCQRFLERDGPEPIDAMMVGTDFGVVSRLTPDGSSKAMALFIQHRTDDGARLINRTIRYVAGVGIGTILVAVIMIMFMSRGLSKPINQLVNGAIEIGKGNLDYRVKLDSKDEIETLARAFNSMSVSLQRHMRDLKEETQLRERLESELRIASELQRALLPAEPPRFPNLGIAAWTQPAREVGGDFYDFIPMGPHRMGIAIGDATGKGLPAALLLTECWSVFRALAKETDSPAELLVRTNRALCERVDETGRFVTVFFMIVDTQAGEIRYAQGGHNPPVMIQRVTGQRLWLKSQKGLPLGIDRRCIFEETRVPFSAHDTIILYSDGITEARGLDGALYGDQRLLQTALDGEGDSLEGFLIRLRSDIEQHVNGADQSDDMTLVVVRYEPEDVKAVDPGLEPV